MSRTTPPCGPSQNLRLKSFQSSPSLQLSCHGLPLMSQCGVERNWRSKFQSGGNGLGNINLSERRQFEEFTGCLAYRRMVEDAVHKVGQSMAEFLNLSNKPERSRKNTDKPQPAFLSQPKPSQIIAGGISVQEAHDIQTLQGGMAICRFENTLP